MSIKDLFNKSSQVVVSSSLNDLSEDTESPEYISEFISEQDRVEPHIDFSDPANFSKYGSAQEYYEKSLEYIYDEYPYDGSLKEKIEWRNNASLLDIYLYDNRYPKSTGYGVFASDGWGTLAGSIVNGYGQPASSDYEYINVKGGPNSVYGSSLGTSSLHSVFDSKTNIFDDKVTGSSGPVSATRQSNLQTKLDSGVTVEFWLKTGSLDTALTEKQVVFDLWNGNASSSADYGRLRIEIDGTRASSPFMLTVLSGAVGLSTSSVEIGSNLNLNSFSDWQHYAFSFVNSGTDIVTRLYVNGELSETITTGSNISEITDELEANIGALLTGTFNQSAVAGPNLGSGKLSGSIDEFRFWKTRRTGKQIKRNYFTSDLGGGTNTDTANLDLGVYYKFNEGVTGDTTVDSVVLDYSGRISNGTWTGYPSSNARNTGSAISSASVGTEILDPIVRSTHPDVYSLQEELSLSGSLWDYENNSSLFYTMPSWIIDEDEGNQGTSGNLKKITQIMGSYFDNLDLLIGELPKINMASYPSSSVGHDGNPDKLHKLYPYGHTAIRSFGLSSPELFLNGDFLEYYRNRNETKEFEEDLYTVKSIIYNNIYNNLTNIYKSKGTEKSFRNLIRCFGVGDDVIRLNAYADNDVYKFETKRRADSVRTKAINLNHQDNFAGTVYQYADTSNPNSVSFISGSSAESLTLEDGFPMTLEAEVVFPKKISMRNAGSSTQEYTQITSSLFGMHTARATQDTSPTVTDITWAATDSANFQVFAIRDKIYSKDVKFMLTSSVPFPIPELTSSYYQNAYENQKWNFAVRVKPKGYPHSIASGSLDHTYDLEFYGVNYVADRKINEFTITGSLTKQVAETLLTSPKRVYVGSHKTNFTGSTLQFSDAMITSCRYWFDYVDDETIRNHAIDPDNFGLTRPSRNTYLEESDFPNIQVPEIDSLALYWDFQTVTGSNNGSGSPTTFDGKFVVEDVSSGSLELIGRYNWLGKILKYQHTGRGDGFPINSTGSVENLFLYSGRQQLPEIVFGDDNIRVFNREETEVFTRETRPVKTYYAFEKSMYQVISDEIINYFGSIADFNNLIGEPVHRYRQEYKSLNYLRQFFFERVGNTPDLDKFINYYKWIDSALSTMLMQLVPASAQVSDGIDNVVESHILERNKYRSKFPTLEFSASAPEGAAVTINKHLYSWERGHHPVSDLQSDNCFYWNQRAERDEGILTSSNSNVDADRNAILSASLQVFERKWNTPYRYKLEKNRVLHGGINYSENKKTNFYRGMNFPHGPLGPRHRFPFSHGAKGPKNILNAYNVNVVSLKDCNDDLTPKELQKIKYSFGTMNDRSPDSGSLDGIKGEIAMPFNILSGSPDLGGYNKLIQARFLANSQLVNLHSDAYGDRNETPMQGPFTEKYVGGHQYRHVRINNHDANRRGGDGELALNNLDGQYTRPEGWRIFLGGGFGGNGAISLTGPDYDGSTYPDPTRFRAWWWREETAKRPVNIRNILQTTASADSVLSGTLQFGAIGNYEKTYQVVQTSGRSKNNFWFNDVATSASLLPARFATNNPKTTNVLTLIGIRPFSSSSNGVSVIESRGNTFIPGAAQAPDDPTGTPITRAERSLGNQYEPFQNAVTSNRNVLRLPERSEQNAVIVERFSAPGGPEISSLGFLDVVAAEKSVYNALPFRNLSVRGSGSGENPSTLVSGSTMRVVDHQQNRRGLRTLHSLHAGPFGKDGTFGTIAANSYTSFPSFHKVNRNTSFRINLVQEPGDPSGPGHGSTEVASTGSSFDNFFVQHPIPQNDFQYAWISASYSGSRPIGHAHRSGFVSGTNSFYPTCSYLPAINFLTASDVTGASGNPVDFAGLNTFFRVPTASFNMLSSSGGLMSGGIGVGPTGSINIELDFFDAYYEQAVPNDGNVDGEHVANGYLIHLNRGIGGFSSWKQISNQYHSLVRQFRKNNTYSIIDPDTERATLLSRRGKYRGYEWDGLKNNREIFGQKLKFQKAGVPTYRLTQDRNVLEFHEPAVERSFKPVRFTTYLEGNTAATIVAPYANQKKYFTNSKLNDKLGLDENSETSADLVLESFRGNMGLNKLINIQYSEKVYPAANNAYRSYVRERPTYDYERWKFLANDRRGNISMITGDDARGDGRIGYQMLTRFSTTASVWRLDGPVVLDTRPGEQSLIHDLNYIYGAVSTPQLTAQSKGVHPGGAFGTANPGTTAPDARRFFQFDPACGILQNVHTVVHTNGASGSHSGVSTQRNITASCLYARPHTLATGSSAGSRTNGTNKRYPPSGSIAASTSGTGSGWGFWDGNVGGGGVKDSLRIDMPISTFQGQSPWDAGNISGKYPFYNSYAEYAQEMKQLGKEYSILPEYRMSDRVEDYIVNDVDPFTDTAILSLTGALANQTTSNKSDFYKIYSHSDFMKYFDVLDAKVSDNVSIESTTLKVKCSAIIKLLPYDGFYPANRTVQLYELFSASYGPNLTLQSSLFGGFTSETLDTSANMMIRPFITPLFAPGVLYNTIKSGIAVDFPVLTGSVLSASAITGADTSPDVPPSAQRTGSTAGINWLIANPNFDYRVPFESLIEPEAHLANITFLDMEPHPSASVVATASWDGNGDSRYRKAMHNFLAEVPEFFLENGTFTSFASSPSNNWKFEKGKTYKMRVQIRKSMDDPLGQKVVSRLGTMDADRTDIRLLTDSGIPQAVSGSETFVMYDRPTAFGPPSFGARLTHNNSAGARGAGSTTSIHGGCVHSGFGGGSLYGYNAPFTPAYYDGAAWVDLEVTPGFESPTFDELISQMTSSYLRYKGVSGADWADNVDHAGEDLGPQAGARMNDNANQISSSVNIFGKARYFDPNTQEQDERWVIQTKFETPMLNFIDQHLHEKLTPVAIDTNTASLGTGSARNIVGSFGSILTRPIGMWHQYGRLPTGQEGVFLEVIDHPDVAQYNRANQIGTGSFFSMADALNMPKESQRLGTPAETKTIREAVVAVPFYEEYDQESGSNQRKFFAIDKNQIDYILGRNPELSTQKPQQSIVDMVESMKRYHFPHSMDFIRYSDKVSPFTMYIFEFEHELTREDVTDIWQNLPPRIGRAFSPETPLETSEVMQTKEVSHDLAPGELLNAPLKSKLQWMVFKVKQKAKKNYYKKSVAASPVTQLPTPAEVATSFDPSGLEMGSVVTSKPSITDQLSKKPDGIFEYLADGAALGAASKDEGGSNTEDYHITYNWPYDFFSLVEMVKIDQEVQFNTGESMASISATSAMSFTDITSYNEATPISFGFNNNSLSVSFEQQKADMIKKFEIGKDSASVIDDMASTFEDYQNAYERGLSLAQALGRESYGGWTNTKGPAALTTRAVINFEDPGNPSVVFRVKFTPNASKTSSKAIISKVITRTT